jgi:hypothetical protein
MLALGGGDGARRRTRQRVNQFGQSRGSCFPRHSARLVASIQGSTSSRASAERTLSPVPFRSSQIDAPRNSSNSDPMSGDQRGMGHVSTLTFSLSSATRSQTGATASAL